MENKKYHFDEQQSHVDEETALYGHSEAQEIARRREAILMSDTEKFKLFCRMMRIGKMLSTAKVIHKK